MLALIRSNYFFLLVAFMFGLPFVGNSQCVTPELIMINSCIEHPNPNGGPLNVESEILIIRTGLVPVEVSTIGVEVPFTGLGPANANIGTDSDGNQYNCPFKQPTVTALSGCPNAIPAGPNDIIPPGALVVVFITGTTVTEDVAATDFSNICPAGQPVYILQNDCNRTAGAFANTSGQGDPLRTVGVSSPCGTRLSSYNTAGLNPENGTYYIVGANEIGNQDCDFPPLPLSCAPVDTTFYLCGYGAVIDPPISVGDFVPFFSSDVLLISLHRSPEDAELNDNSLSFYSGPTDRPDTLYSRIIYGSTLCTTVSRFIIEFPDTDTPLRMACELVSGASGPNAADGEANIRFETGLRPFQLAYVGAAAGAMQVNGTSVDLSGLPGGEYAFAYTDANGCRSDTCRLNVPVVDFLNIQCLTRNNSNDANVLGAGQVDISGGEAPFTVTLTDASGNSSTYLDRQEGITVLPGLPSGAYSVSVADASGQVETCSFTIVSFACPLTIPEIRLAIDCSEPPQTLIRLTIAGNDGAVTTAWSGGNGISAFDGMQEAGPLPPGVYFVTVGDQSACPAITEGPIVITAPDPIGFSVAGDFLSSPCQDDARIDVTLNGGGNPPYDVVLINWNTGAELDRVVAQTAGSTVSFPGLAGGGTPDYGVYVADALGCETNRTFNPIVASPDPNIILNPADQQITPPTCSGDSTGTASLSASGGTAPYTYRWTSYPQLATGRVLPDGPAQTDLPAGNYSLDITDANGCTAAASFVVSDGSTPVIACGATTEATLVQGGSVSLGFNDGAMPYVITLIRGNTSQSYANLTASPETITGLGGGNYLAVVEDNNGCVSDTCSFTITQAACSLSATAMIDTIVCQNMPSGRIALDVSGGATPYVFTWGPGATGSANEVSVSLEGNYSVRIEDANGCSLDTMFFVPNLMRQTQLNLDTPPYLPDCPGEDVLVPLEFVGTGPFNLEYIVTPEAGVERFRTFTTSLSLDTLIIPATDFVADSLRVSSRLLTDQFCENLTNQTFVVRYNAPDTIRRTDATCAPGPLEIGGRFFDAQNPSDTFLVNDGSACGVIYEVSIDFMGGAALDTIRRTEATCAPGPLEIGGRFFDVQNPSDTFLFNDGSACGVIYAVDIDFMTGEALDTTLVQVCAATPYVENGEVFDANRPEGEVRYVRPGLCDSVIYVRLDVLPEFIGSYSENACAGDTIFYADRFFTAENTSGLARLPGMAATGCDSLVFVNTSFRRTGEVRLFGDFDICPGEPIELRFTYDGPGGIDVRMRDLAGNITELPNIRQGSRVELFPTESTGYELLSAQVGGCSGEVAGTSSVVVSNLSVGAEVLLDPGDYCQDTLGVAAVSYSEGTGPYNIAWSNGSPDSINRNLLAGTYQVSVTDAIGCTVSASVVLNELRPLTARVAGVPPACPGENGVLRIDTIFGGGDGGYEFSIDDQLFLPIDQLPNIEVEVGNHRVVFQDANGCSTTVDFSVNDALRPDFNLPMDTTILLGDSIFLDGSLLNQDTAWWTPQEFLSAPNAAATWARPLSSTTFTLHLRTLAQCIFTQDVNIRVDRRLPVFAPTAFSPNGDGVNDLYVLGLGRSVRALKQFQVFNRWGNIMYEGIDGWDGEFAGGPAPSAVYVFYAIVEMEDGGERFLKGDFVLMR